MALTRDFKELVQKQIAADLAYREVLLRESIDTMLAGDVDTGKTILRDYHKGDYRLRAAGRRNRHAAEKSDPHVRPARQSAGPQPVRRAGSFAAPRGPRPACRGGTPINGLVPGVGRVGSIRHAREKPASIKRDIASRFRRK